MKVLLLGEHYSNNLGDALISECFQTFLSKRNIDYQLVDLSGKTQILPGNNLIVQENTIYQLVKQKLRDLKCVQVIISIKLAKRIVQQLRYVEKENTIAIYDGGSLFMDYFAAKHFYINKYLSKCNIEVYYCGCGLGKIDINLNKAFLKKALNFSNVKNIFLRDSVSTFNQQHRKKASQTYDIALLVSDYIRPSSKNKKIGIGFISLNENFDKNYISNVYKFIEDLEKDEINWEIFTNGDFADYRLAIDFFYSTNFKFGSLSVRPNTPEELVSIVTSYDRILTARLHSAIIAYSYQIPTMCVCWSDKISEFYKIIGKEDLVLQSNFYRQDLYSELLNVNYGEYDKERLDTLKNYLSCIIDGILNKEGVCGDGER